MPSENTPDAIESQATLDQTITIEQGWLSSARRVATPNVNTRPDNETISVLVIHNISLPPSQFENGCIEQFFTNQLPLDAHPYFAEIAGLQVSAHVLITRAGEVIQFVPFDLRAWHAGSSCFKGRDNCNDFSIGIELEGTDEIAYTSSQYEVLVQVTNSITTAYPAITIESIVGHSDISPGRKTDPGESFDWQKFYRLLAKVAPITLNACPDISGQ
ncbi:MAG: AmpD protein [Candidatus Endobugula sp.]|jgi:AmpD protein